MTVPNRRQARRSRDKEDFLRATRAAVPAKFRAEAGRHAGPTYREHLENKLESAVKAYNLNLARGDDDKARTARGMIRGLAIALLIYEDSYSMNDKAKLLKLEKEFMS
jgi:hypothetical protein